MSQFPLISGATRVDNTLLNGMMDNFVIKPSDETRASNVTSANDTHLIFTATANAVYQVDLEINFGALQAAGIRTRWAVPAGTTGNRRCAGPMSTVAVNAAGDVTDLRWAVLPYATDSVYTDPRNAVASLTWLWERAIVRVGGTGGTVGLMWAQNVTNATGTVVGADSVLRYRQIG